VIRTGETTNPAGPKFRTAGFYKSFQERAGKKAEKKKKEAGALYLE
jgi:hypothetical protein